MTSLAMLFIKGLVFGMTIAAIPGAIFLLIVQRTLAEGVGIGVACGLGAVVADVFYALIAAIGLTLVTKTLMAYQAPIALIGGSFLIYLGLKTFFQKSVARNIRVAHTKNLFAAWLSTLLLTLTNPISIISYTVIFAGLGMGSDNLCSSLVVVGGVLVGELIVELAIVGFVGVFHKRLSDSVLMVINRIAGMLLIGFGIVAFTRIVA